MPSSGTINLHGVEAQFLAVERKLQKALETASSDDKKALEQLIKRLSALRTATLANCPRAYGLWPVAAKEATAPRSGMKRRRKASARVGSRKA